jgi:mannose-6-phosphate isomerase-like protein (cupin superfamily)
MSTTLAEGRVPITRKPAVRLRSGLVLLMRIERWDAGRDGILTEAAVVHKLKTLGYDPLPRPIPSGAIASARVHRRDRVEAVLAGLLKVTIDGESAILTAGDVVFIPAGAARRVEAVGTSPVQCLEAVLRTARG